MTTMRPARLPDIIADRIQAEILDERLVPGDQLPTEPQLSERYDVSRTVVREAARILEHRGLVTIRPGRGMIVAELDATPIARHYALLLQATPQAFRHLMDIRMVLEVHIAGLAAENRTEQDVEKLRASLAEERAASADAERSVREDLRFHALVSGASGNPLMGLLIDPINECLRQTYRAAASYLDSIEHTIVEHTAIFAAIEAGDRAAAEDAARRHLERVRDDTDAISTPL